MIVFTPITITDAILVNSNVPEDDNTEWSSATSYQTGDDVMVSTVEPNIHRNYEALQPNQNQPPWTNPTAGDPAQPIWLNRGATKRWRMFDQGNATQTTNPNTIDVTLRPNQTVNSLALLNINAASVQVIMTDPTAGEVYNRTFNLVSDSGINDWYAYFFTPIDRESDLVALDLPNYSQADIRVIVSNTGQVSVGVLAIGSQIRLGETDYGSSSGIRDYSVKETDAFGNFTITERPFSRRVNLAVTINSNRASFVDSTMISLRNTPTIWIGSSQAGFGNTIAYGYYRDYEITLTGYTLSILNITVEGLT